MTALSLNPYDNNILSCRLINQQLTDNSLDVVLSENVSASSDSQTPKLVLDGTGKAYLTGSVTITTGSGSADFNLLSLPSKINPVKDFNFPVFCSRSSAYISQGVTLVQRASGITGVIVESPGSYSTLPTLSVVGDGVGASLSAIMLANSAIPVTAQSGAGSYAPNDTITLSGGTFSQAAVLRVTNTMVQSATVVNGGGGGTNGTQTVTGTTGTGTKFQASVTITGGSITAVNSISVNGNYTANPTSIVLEPVTGAGLTGATLSLSMGVLSASVITAGSYTVLPSNPVSQGSTSGAGTGATFTLLWGILGALITSSGNGYTEENTSINISGAGSGIVNPVFSGTGPSTLVLTNQPDLNDVISLDGISFFVENYF
jgi:hypothetical protein